MQRLKNKFIKQQDPDEIVKADALRQSNWHIWGLLLKTDNLLLNFMDLLKQEIEEVKNDYKGFIDLDDKEFFEK